MYNNRKCICNNSKENRYNNIKEKKEELENKLLITTLKGLGHTILGNFSTDRMVIELTKISKTVQNYRRTLTKHREAKKGHGWTKLERIEMD